jgi:predicted 3-demethylubiquinone-9 3-methyltransferase (glyoxalase superfamily)
MLVEFQLAGITYLALNGGPHYQLTEAVSLSVDCQDQVEVDELWNKLTQDGGSPSRCGWLKDRFGLSWQLVPSLLPQLLSNKDKALRVMAALMQMTKIDIAQLQAAAEAS